MSESLVSYLHYLGFMVLFAALVAQHLLFSTRLTPAQTIRLARLDGIYGMAALVVLVTGLLKVFVVGKPAVFYAHNAYFHAKVTLFLLLAFISIWPTIKFQGAAKQARRTPQTPTIALPRAIVACQRAQLLGVLLIPLLAAFMVRAV